MNLKNIVQQWELIKVYNRWISNLDTLVKDLWISEEKHIDRTCKMNDWLLNMYKYYWVKIAKTK